MLKVLAILGICAAVAFGVGCVRHSGGVWHIREAPTPQGWPEFTPVGEIELRTYPTYREAVTHAENLGNTGMSPMFNELFGHISDRNIAMTAPVDFGYDDQGRVNTMAFLYRSAEQGRLEIDGPVHVQDTHEQTFVSIGVRGNYNRARFFKGTQRLDSWLESNTEYVRDGVPRYLGYNGPFTLPFLRYGEVQIPVRPASE